ncbi:uncharacterized protein RHO25_004258 [Cercospora beticola]|uniref:Uncharacterized protein n=1 Tax=Cercospora beticola TaxID=122368 RepID=A0ABZ0NJC4_CERBT|nr:hypothetical protein RHO25_004258 [Cercospora beticola]
MVPAAEIQAKTLQKYIDGWRGWTVDGFLASWSEKCTQQALPLSSGKPLMTRAEATKLFPHLMSVMSDFKVGRHVRPMMLFQKLIRRQVTIHNVVHDVAHNKAALYALSESQTPFGLFKNEHAIFLYFDASGEYVDRIEEMFDALAMKEALPKISAYVAKNNGLLAGATAVQSPLSEVDGVVGASGMCSTYS